MKSFLNDLSEFVSEHGARGPYEWDAASETWEVKPESVLAAIDAMRHADETLSPANRHGEAVADREAAEAEVGRSLMGMKKQWERLSWVYVQLGFWFLVGRERNLLR